VVLYSLPNYLSHHAVSHLARDTQWITSLSTNWVGAGVGRRCSSELRFAGPIEEAGGARHTATRTATDVRSPRNQLCYS